MRELGKNLFLRDILDNFHRMIYNIGRIANVFYASKTTLLRNCYECGNQ